LRKLAYGFRLKNVVDFEELPREVQIAKILRFRGVRVDRLKMTVVVPFDERELDVYEFLMLEELKHDFHFMQLPWEPPA